MIVVLLTCLDDKCKVAVQTKGGN